MRIRELTEEGGVGVVANNKKQAKDPRYSTSMTVDIKPGETQRQAAKFGNKLDKKGNPPTLSKKVKGKSTNVMFNLGMTEGYKLQLERDKEMLVLNIKDTATGRRTEVRGKPGYETGNYDPNDKLHMLLDKIGKSADISQLMNGEPVGINPKHPTGASAKAATDKAYSENKLLDKPTPSIKQLSKKHNVDKDDIISQVKKGVKVELEHTSDPKIALEIALDHINELPDYYDRLETVEENFADGKKKGKSRPGRVKRSGASCNGSVTALRKRAKNASGEKAKMYHWCANMKGGKKKK